MVEASPKHAKAHTNLARALLDLKELDKGLEHAIKGAELLGDSSAYNALGRAYMKTGDNAKAAEAFGKAIEKDPKNPWPYNNKAYNLMIEHKGYLGVHADEIIELLEKAVELAPKNELFQRNLDFMKKIKGEVTL